MTVTVEGLNESFVKKAVKLFCDALSIDVPNLEIFTDETINRHGVCYHAGDNSFMILLLQRDLGQMMVTLAHEMVHVKQYLIDNLEEKFDSTIPYMDRWWEKEAFEKEVTLTKLLIEAVENGEV